MKVNKISPASGTAITLGDSGDTFTIPSGVTLSGSGASLTNLPAGNLTGALPAISGANLTGISTVATSFIGGLKTSNAADAAHDVTIAVGSARDYTDTATMTLASAITKQIDASWAVGTNAGGLDTGSVAANTGYGLYLIRRTDTGVVDVLFSTDMSAAGGSVTMPTSYTQKRLIGWVRTDGSSNIISYLQSGDTFRLLGVIPTELTDSSITDEIYEDLTTTVPPLSTARYYLSAINVSQTDGNSGVTLKTKGAAETAVNMMMTKDNTQTSNHPNKEVCVWGDVLTNATGVIEYAGIEDSAALTIVLYLIGCNLHTRSNP